jgi:predicted DNA-binding WGR domain protein
MARTINRGAGRGGRGGNYGRGRGYGRGKGGGRGGRQGVVWTRKARECNTPCHNPANNDLRDRYRKYYEFICATNEETRQEPGTYLKVLKGIYYHGEEVDSYDAALKVKGVGPMHARKCASAVRWREHLDASIVPVQRGRWAAPPRQEGQKPRWWRVETVEVPSTGKCMARRQWGLEGTAGYDEDFKDFSERRKCDLDVASWIRKKEGEGYQRSAHGADDGADHYVPPQEEEEQREVVPRVRKSKYGPKFLDKDTGSLSGVCALLVALHRRSPLDKASLAQEAQQHTRVAMTANGQQWYGGIKSLDTLLKNDIVEPVPHDVRRYRLTSEAGSGLVAGADLCGNQSSGTPTHWLTSTQAWTWRAKLMRGTARSSSTHLNRRQGLETIVMTRALRSGGGVVWNGSATTSTAPGRS